MFMMYNVAVSRGGEQNEEVNTENGHQIWENLLCVCINDCPDYCARLSVQILPTRRTGKSGKVTETQS